MTLASVIAGDTGPFVSACFARSLEKGPIYVLIRACQTATQHPVDGWTIAFQANGPQGAWTTLWTGVDGPKRPPAHCPDHRDCPHPRAFAHAPHRAKGVTGSIYRVFMVTVTVNQEAGQRLRRGPRLRGSVSSAGLPTPPPLLHNTKSIHTRRARRGDKTILKQRLTLASVRVE